MSVISTILNTNTELYNYLNNVNYGMSKPQFNHLSSIINGLINIKGNKTISQIAEGIVSAKDKSSIYKFLSRSKWDDSLLNRNRMFLASINSCIPEKNFSSTLVTKYVI